MVMMQEIDSTAAAVLEIDTLCCRPNHAYMHIHFPPRKENTGRKGLPIV